MKIPHRTNLPKFTNNVRSALSRALFAAGVVMCANCIAQTDTEQEQQVDVSYATNAVCDNGWADCNEDLTDGCEVDITSDAENCDGCGNACTLPNAVYECEKGSCILAQCNAGYGDCNGDTSDGCEADLNGDDDHCSACGNACPSRRECVQGRCIRPRRWHRW